MHRSEGSGIYGKNDKSAYTISKEMAALNKLFNLFVTKKEAGIKSINIRI